MRKFTKFSTVAALAIAITALVSGGASAQNNRSFVSSQGSDSNSCGLAAPCRSFAQALSQTNPGGEILVLDSAGYGPVTITQSVSINAPDGIEGGITATAGHGVTIAAGPGDVVSLRGLTITGIGSDIGINFTSGAGLNIQNCNISGFSQYGIRIQPTMTTSFAITDSVSSANHLGGIFISVPAQVNVTGVIARSLLANNSNGLEVVSNQIAAGSITVTNSIISNNHNDGIINNSTSPLVVQILQSQVTGNSTGLSGGELSFTEISQVTFSNFMDIVDANGGNTATISSFQNNIVATIGNGTTIAQTPFR